MTVKRKNRFEANGRWARVMFFWVTPTPSTT